MNIQPIVTAHLRRIGQALLETARAELPRDIDAEATGEGLVLTGRALVARAWGRHADPRFRALLSAVRMGGRR